MHEAQYESTQPSLAWMQMYLGLICNNKYSTQDFRLGLVLGMFLLLFFYFY